MRVQGVTGVFSVLFGIDPDRVQHSIADAEGRDYELGNQFWTLMKEQNIYASPDRWFLNIVHSPQDINRALEAADKAMGML